MTPLITLTVVSIIEVSTAIELEKKIAIILHTINKQFNNSDPNIK